MNEEITIKPQVISPLKKICMTIGELPTSYLETMSYYEMLVWFIHFLRDNVIPVVNNNGEAVTELQNLFVELQNYVNNYFDNLDVQDEINNKLDQMLEDGVLEQIIEQFLQLTSLICFDNVADMKASVNLANGSYAKTLGFYTLNDNGGAVYKIRQVTNQDVEDNMTIIPLNNSNLVAELINNGVGNVHQFGAKGDGISNDYTSIITAINNLNVINFIGDKTYLCNSKITLDNVSKKVINGNNAILKLNEGTIDTELVTEYAFFDIMNSENININNLIINTNGNWMMRPHVDYGMYNSTDPDVLEWKDRRKKTYGGLGIWNSTNINVYNIKTMNSRTGFYVRGSSNIKLNNCISNRTFADGIYICTTSKFIYVNNHYCEDTGDDCYSADGWADDNTPSYVYFTDCYALRSGGALICADSSKHINYTNIYGEEINYSPFKYECNWNNADDISLYNVHAKIVQNPELGEEFAYVTGTQNTSFKITNVVVENSSIEYTGPTTRRIEWRHRTIDNIKYINCKIKGITPLFYENTTNVTLEDSYFETQDALTFVSYDYGKVLNCKIVNKGYFSARAYSGILLNGVTNLILKDNSYTIETDQTHHDITFLSSTNSEIYFDTFDLNGYNGNISNIQFYAPIANSYWFTSCKNYQLAISSNKVTYIISGQPIT